MSRLSLSTLISCWTRTLQRIQLRRGYRGMGRLNVELAEEGLADTAGDYERRLMEGD